MSRVKATLVSAVASLTLALTALSARVSAQSNNTTTLPPYYNNSTTPAPDGAWMAGSSEASLPNIIDLILRVGTVIVGPGGTVAGGGGPTGPMLFGFLLIGGAFSAVIGTGMGSVAAGVVFVVVLSGVVTLGFAPSWLFAVLLFGLGVLLYRAFQSVVQ